MSYEPLTITARLSGPVIMDRPQPFDGILAATIIESPHLRRKYHREVRRWRRNVEKYGREDATRFWGEKGWTIPHEHFVPVDVWGHGLEHALWVYRCSWAGVRSQGRGIVYFNHHFDAELAERVIAAPRKHKRIQTSKGQFKSEHLPLQYDVTDEIVWSVCGDGEAIEEILASVRAIGKKRNRGFGSVLSWRVERAANDESVFTVDGHLVRPVPLQLLQLQGIAGDWETGHTSYRPPYWANRYVTRCAVAGVRR